MNQDLNYKSLVARKSAEEDLFKPSDSLDEGPLNNLSIMKEQLKAAQDSIKFLQKEHTLLLKGLHEEIERLQDKCRDFFKCSPECLEEKVNNILQENSELKRKLTESHQAIDILDQKEKLALWQHHQELEQRDNAIYRLEKELQSKCNTLSQISSQGVRRKKGSFWRRFTFISSNHPSTSTSAPHDPLHHSRVEHLSKEDLPSEMQNSLQSFESQYQSYSSYSSLSDKSVSDDEGFGQRCDTDEKPVQDSKLSVKLPPITNLPLVSSRQIIRQQLRMNKMSDTMAIDQMQGPPPELSVKRLNKAS